MTEINIREATVNDLEAIAKIHVDAWRHNYIDIVPQAVLDRMSYDIQEEKWAERLFTNNLENESRMFYESLGGKIKNESSRQLEEKIVKEVQYIFGDI